MKNDPVTKLYSGLTDKERAVLAYSYITKQNDIEHRRIESTMPMQYFVGLPLDYRSQKNNLNCLALFYAFTYWRQIALCLSFSSGTMALLSDDDPEAYLPMMKRFDAAEGRLLAIEQAFDAVCAEHGLDLVTMRFMAGNQYYEIATPDLTPDAEHLAGMREIFSGMLAG